MRADSDIRIRAGQLRHPVNIMQQVGTVPPTFGPGGGPLYTWTNFLTNVRAQISPARSQQVVRNGQTVNETFIPISVRYDPRIQANMRVAFYNSRAGATFYYLVTGLGNIDERNWLIELQCLALGANI